ncbi:MAG: M48 family metalloprotease [Deltaproteobacteria bacterium]|nr:M48 family metalloprotease [Deltaproteobacteria bacterium]
MNRFHSAIILATLFLCGCATTGLPPVTSKDYALEGDEKNIWALSLEMEKGLSVSGLPYADEALERYLNGVAEKLAVPETKGRIAFRIRVLKNPHLNAFALPTGSLYLHTGILAQMENEAQLATLLAHEMTHTTHRHAVKQFRDVKNKTAWLASTIVLTGAYGAVLGGLGIAAAVTGYSRELETEADMEGIKLVVAAGYDPREAPKLFEHLKKEIEEEKISEPFFFGTHPRIQERIENYETLLKTEYAGRTGISNGEAFFAATREVILENARLDLKMGRFGIARRGAEKYISIQGKDARGHHLLGEVFRQKGEKEDEEKAIAEYRKAIELDSSYPDSHKCLGMIRMKKGEKAEAKKHFERYLALAPKAPDRGYVEEYLKAME